MPERLEVRQIFALLPQASRATKQFRPVAFLIPGDELVYRLTYELALGPPGTIGYCAQSFPLFFG